MLRAYKFRVYPSKSRAVVMASVLDVCRNLYNSSLAERKDSWENGRKSISYPEQQNSLPVQKEKDAALSRVHSQVLQDVLRRVDKAFKGFFRRANDGEKPGYPRFRGAFRYDSFTYPQEGGFSLDCGRLRLSKIGAVSIRLHRSIPEGAILKTCNLKREEGRWYACITVEMPYAARPARKTGRAVGVDVGLASLLTLSTGEKVANPRWFKKSEELLAKGQRKLSRKRKGSGNRFRQRMKVARIHRRIGDQRRDFNHKVSRRLVSEFDAIVFECLNVREMIENGFLSKSIGDAGWSQLMGFVQYKAEEAGVAVEFVDARNTSQACSECGKIVQKTLKERMHNCPYCGLAMERDFNAARNILSRSTLGTRGRACGELLKQFNETGSPRI